MAESNLHRIVFEAASDARILLEHDTLFECNRAAAELFGCGDKKVLLQQTLADLSAKLQRSGEAAEQLIKEHIAQAVKQGSHHFEWLYQRCDGTTFDAAVDLTVYEYAGDMALQMVVRDISSMKAFELLKKQEHKRLQEQVAARTQDLGLEITRHRETAKQLHKISFEDSLTKIGNRQHIINRLSHALALAERQASSVALLSVDIDNFKSVNSGIGYHTGDKVLCEVARRLQSTVRSSDSIGRLCGDEFAIIVEFSEDKKDALTIADKVFKAIAQPINIDGKEIFLKISTGISFFPEDSADVMDLLQTSNFAMRKAASSDQHACIYSKSMYEELAHRFRLGNDLRYAIANNELHLLLQPKVQLSTGKIIGAEALIRWNHPELGPVSPVEFIGIAEKNGLIISIGDWVIRESCRIAKSWKQAGFCSQRIAINISAMQFEHDGFVAGVHQYMQDYGLSAADIELEFTEGLAMKNPEQGILILRELSDMGLTIAIDDFGTGYSSLSYLKQLPINTLKIDRVFVKDICTDTSDLILVELIISMAKLFKLSIVAEGAETAENVAFLEKLGCDIIQGYFYSPPISEKALLVMLETEPFKKTSSVS